MSFDTAAPILARCVRGLEWALLAEVQARLPGAELASAGHRSVELRLAGELAAALDLRCADDVFLTAGHIDGVGHERVALDTLRGGVVGLDLAAAHVRVAALRGAPPTGFDVVGSFVGRRNYSRFEIEDAVAPAIARQTGLRRVDPARRADAELSWRVHLDGEGAVVGLRLGREPLHRRRYRTAPLPGALHPPVAAAMALLAEPPAAGIVVDPWCGSGTICLETALMHPGTRVLAGDIDREATRTTAAHAAAAGVGLGAVFVGDAARMPLPDASVDRILCNPAWGQTVAAGGELRADAARFWGEVARTLTAAGRALVLLEAHPADQALRAHGLRVADRLGLRVAGRWVTLHTVARR